MENGKETVMKNREKWNWNGMTSSQEFVNNTAAQAPHPSNSGIDMKWGPATIFLASSPGKTVIDTKV